MVRLEWVVYQEKVLSEIACGIEKMDVDLAEFVSEQIADAFSESLDRELFTYSCGDGRLLWLRGQPLAQ